MELSNAIEPTKDAVATPAERTGLLSLPPELRIHILEYLFKSNDNPDGFAGHDYRGGIQLDDDYSVRNQLKPLLICRQIHQDGNITAFKNITFVVSNLYLDIPLRLSLLRPKQIQSIRSIVFVADSRHFRKLPDWNHHPFGIPSLRLHTLTIVLHRSSFWHYLFDYTSDIVQLLRTLQGVQNLVFVRNAALVKGSFKTWYNRLVGLILKEDHSQRYMTSPPKLERTCWTWTYDDMAQSFCLRACPAKPLVEEEVYMQQIAPLMEELRVSIENEEWNPDPRSRNMFY